MSKHFSVAIIGGGPAGLTAARRLHLAGVPATVFEMRSKEEHMKPGSSGTSGSLDLDPDSGQYAIRKADLWNEYEALLREGGEDMKIGDKTGKLYLDSQGDPEHPRPECDRSDLTRILRDSIPPQSLRFGYKLRSVSETAEGRWSLEFDGCEKEQYEFDFVVGADGAWSHVRRLLTDEKPFYSGVACITIHVKDADQTAPEVAKLVGRANYWCFDDQKSVQAQRGAHGTIRTYLMLRRDDPAFTYPGPNGSTIDLAKLPAKELFSTLVTHPDLYATWSDGMKKLILASSEDPDLFWLRPLYMLPVGITWKTRPGVTLIGDAGHLMTPFSGEGVNAAMLDAIHVADEITKAWKGEKSVEAATSDYEKEMWPRMKKETEICAGNIPRIFADNPAPGFAKMMEGHMRGDDGV